MSDAEARGEPSMPAEAVVVEVSGDVATAIAQLRRLICGLGAGLIVVSLALSAFIYKQNTNLSATSRTRMQQLVALQQSQQVMNAALVELSPYAKTNSDLSAIFERHGLVPTVAGGR
jgi:hypothetical protein